MKAKWLISTATLALILNWCPARADVAVSIRYFKEEGTSHYQLFLYHDDGKLVRQLTAPEDAHDTDPIFSPDGKEIAFARSTKQAWEWWIVRTDGTRAHAVENPPEWAQPHPEAPFRLSGSGDNDALWKPSGEDLMLEVPGKPMEVVLKAKDNLKVTEQFDAIAFKTLSVRAAGSTTETPVTVMGEVDDSCDLMSRNKSPFLLQPHLHAMLYWQHLGSTDGFRIGALDLEGKKAVFLSENPAEVIPHGHRDGFFTVCQHRYQPLGKTDKTVNCLYLDWWNVKYERIRFAKAISLFGGASVRIAGEPPLEIPKPEH